MFIDIPPHIEQIIVNQAQQQGISVSELIVKTFTNQSLYPKGDIRRLKGIIKTDIKVGVDEMNQAIAIGALLGESYGK